MNLSPVRRPLGAVAAALALAAAIAAPAHADPADLTNSSIVCTAVDGATRSGDHVQCLITARILGPANANAVTADVSIPPSMVYDPPPFAQGDPDDPLHPTSVHFGTVVLGLMNPGFPKPTSIRMRVAEDAEPGAAIQPILKLRNGTEPDATIAANLLNVMPQPAAFEGSTTVCVDAGEPPLRAGDTMECTFVLANALRREDAVGVVVSAPIPQGTTWAAGGNETFHTDAAVTWLSGALPDGVKSGTSAAPLRFRVVIDPTLVGGTLLYVNGTVGWQNALSGSSGSLGLGAPAVVVAPGPAVLTGSSLGCNDQDGGALLAGDTLVCTLTVAATAGHEDVGDIVASAGIPGRTSAGSPTDASGLRIPFAPALFGTIAAGAARPALYVLHIADDAPTGTAIAPTAVVAGRSVPSGVAVSHALTAGPFYVGSRAVVAVVTPATATAPAVPVAATAATPARASNICASRRVVVVNVKPPKGKHWKSVTFAFAKKTFKGKKASSKGTFRARLVFQGLPKGPLKVSIVGVTTKGKKVRRARTYNLCTKKQ